MGGVFSSRSSGSQVQGLQQQGSTDIDKCIEKCKNATNVGVKPANVAVKPAATTQQGGRRRKIKRKSRTQSKKRSQK